MKQLLILSVMCCVGYIKDQGSLSYIPRSSYVSLFPKFLRVSYFYERARTHEVILDGEIDLDSHTNGFYFPNLAKIRHAHRCTRNPVAFFYLL